MNEEIMRQFARWAEQVGTVAMDAALNAVRVQSVAELLGGIFAAAMATSAIRYANRRFDELEKAEKRKENDDVGAIVVGVIGLALAVPTVFVVLNIWTWVAIFRPEWWLAKRVLGL